MTQLVIFLVNMLFVMEVPLGYIKIYPLFVKVYTYQAWKG